MSALRGPPPPAGTMLRSLPPGFAPMADLACALPPAAVALPGARRLQNTRSLTTRGRRRWQARSSSGGPADSVACTMQHAAHSTRLGGWLAGACACLEQLHHCSVYFLYFLNRIEPHPATPPAASSSSAPHSACSAVAAMEAAAPGAARLVRQGEREGRQPGVHAAAAAPLRLHAQRHGSSAGGRRQRGVQCALDRAARLASLLQ